MGTPRYDDATVVLPTYNEADSLAQLIPSLQFTLPGVHIVVADDGSTDGTPDVVRAFQAADPKVRLLDRSGRDRGLTAAVADAFLVVRTPIAVCMDGDGQHPVEAAPRLIQAVRDGADIAAGDRTKHDGLSGPRRFVSGAAAGMTHAYLLTARRPRVHDVMSGLFAVDTRFAQGIVHAHGHGFERPGFKILLDLLKHAPRGTPVADVPYEFQKRLAGESKLALCHVQSLFRQLGPIGALAAALCVPRVWRFAAVGGTGVIVNLALFSLLLQLDVMPLAMASAAAVEAAVLWNFGLNRRWTWRDRPMAFVPALLRFHAVSLVAMAANVAVLLVLVDFGLHAVPAQGLGVLLGAAGNFAGNHFWTFAPARTPSGRRVAWYLAAAGVHLGLAAGFADPATTFKVISTVDQITQGLPATALGPVPLALLTPVMSGLLAAGAGPLVLRLGAKLPVLLALPIIALSVRSMAARHGSRRTADAIERMILLNPLSLVLIAMGAMETVAVAALILAVVAADRRQHVVAGIALGVGVLTGPVALAALPVLIVWSARSEGRAAARKLAAGSLVVLGTGLAAWMSVAPLRTLLGAAVRLAGEGPGGLSLTRVAEYPAWLGWVGLTAPAVPLGVMVTVSFATMGLVVVGATCLAARGRTLSDLVVALAALFAGIVITSPVVVAADSFAPIVLVGLLAVLPTSTTAPAFDTRRARRTFLVAAPVAALGALVLDGHAFLLLPPDVALRFFGTSADAIISGIGGPVGVTRAVTGLMLDLGAVALHITGLIVLARGLMPPLLDALPTAAVRVSLPTLRAPASRAMAAALVVGLLLPPAAAANLILDTAADVPVLPDARDGRTDPTLAIVVRTVWSNPAFDPALRYGPWLTARTSPERGYYETDQASLADGLWGAYDVGAGTIALEAVPWAMDRFTNGAQLASSAGFAVVPVLDMAALMSDPALQSPLQTESSDERVARAVDGAVVRAAAALRQQGLVKPEATVPVLVLEAHAIGTKVRDPATLWGQRGSMAATQGVDLIAVDGPFATRVAQPRPGESPELWHARMTDLRPTYVYLQPVVGADTEAEGERLAALLDATPPGSRVILSSWNDHARGTALEPTLGGGTLLRDAIAARADGAAA